MRPNRLAPTARFTVKRAHFGASTTFTFNEGAVQIAIATGAATVLTNRDDIMLRDDTLETVDALRQLHNAGWSVGEASHAAESGGLVWVVDGHRGDRQLRAEGATQREAWKRALDQAREVGMLGA